MGRVVGEVGREQQESERRSTGGTDRHGTDGSKEKIKAGGKKSTDKLH